MARNLRDDEVLALMQISATLHSSIPVVEDMPQEKIRKLFSVVREVFFQLCEEEKSAKAGGERTFPSSLRG